MVPLSDVIAHLERVGAEFPLAIRAVMQEQMERAAALARSFLGHEQPGWDPLAESTIEDKIRRGFEVPSPLKRTGELEESISGDVTSEIPGVFVGVVGSTSPIAIDHEHGTARIPPRSFLGPAMMLSEPEIKAALDGLARRALTPGAELVAPSKTTEGR